MMSSARTMMLGGGALALLLLPIASLAQAPEASRLDDAVETITEEDFARRVWVIAHDSMQGRDTPSSGLEATAAWIADEFRAFGLRGGAGDGGFIQRYPLSATVVDRQQSSYMMGSVRLRFGDALLPAIGSLPDRTVTAELVVVSGLADLTRAVGREVRGKHVLVAGAAGGDRDRSLASAASFFQESGAVSVSMVNGLAEDQWASAAAAAADRTPTKAWGQGALDAPSVRLHVRRSAAAPLFEELGLTLAELEDRAGASARVDATGREVTLTVRTRELRSSAPNVVAILPGSDAVLADEYVVFSAHMDHVGVRAADESGDSIFNGADDNASGTVAVMEVAEAMAAMSTPPRRSMLFVIVSGEEKGLWGSEWYAGNPTVPLDAMVANLNLDMVGRNWPDTVVAIGKEHSDLGATLERVNAAHPELGMTAIDDLWPEQRFYFRSDHYNFARVGVPILFFFNGTHDDYHGRDDEPDRIDAEKAARIARLVFHLGVELGDAPERPEWDPESYERIVTGR